MAGMAYTSMMLGVVWALSCVLCDALCPTSSQSARSCAGSAFVGPLPLLRRVYVTESKPEAISPATFGNRGRSLLPSVGRDVSVTTMFALLKKKTVKVSKEVSACRSSPKPPFF